MLDFGLPDAHQDASGKRETAPFILTEDQDGLGDASVPRGCRSTLVPT
jgi:hypothetical protein